MTRMQEMSLDYHFTVEQEVGSMAYAFFGFNGKQLKKKSQFNSNNDLMTYFKKKKIKLFFKKNKNKIKLKGMVT